MKIALLSFEYPPETGFGGIGTYTWFHARALSRLGHEVHVVAGATGPCALRSEEKDGVHVWRLRGEGFRATAIASLGRLQWWWSRERLRNALDMFSALRHLERTLTFDVIEMPECGAEGLLVNRLTSAPTVVRFHSPAQLIMNFYDVRRGDVWLCSALERIAMNGATSFTSTSHYLGNAVRAGLKVRAPIPVVHNGIDVRWFDETEQVDVRRAFALPADRPIILFVGRMERRKGIQLCPEIVCSILERHAVSFVFAGDDLFGHVANELLPAVSGRQLRGSVHALGRLGATQVRSLMRQADVVFLPSLWESCPYSCLEAMAAGRAFVASNAGGFPELIRTRESGVLVPSGDVGAFVAALTEVIEDPALRERLGAEARRSVERSFLDADAARCSVAIYDGIRS